MRPGCYNRPPYPEGQWFHVGVHRGTGKPLYRWRRRWFEDRCTQHDGSGIGPRSESYAKAHGFECAGCRWEPARVRQARLFEERMRALPVDKAVDRAAVIHTAPGLWSQALVAGPWFRFADAPGVERSEAEERMRRAWGWDLVMDHVEMGICMAKLSASAMAAINFSAAPDDKL